ncbi:hypothetical protein LQZ18_01665 [Lachnospiraceae bacterium ZAX-1]
MAIDIGAVRHYVELLTEDGVRFSLDGALLSLEREEPERQLAQRVTIKLANISVGKKKLMSIVKLNCPLYVYGEWGDGKHLLFDGIVWEWQYANASENELTITAYDRMIRLQQSKDIGYYSAGMQTQAILSDICNNWGIPLNYQWKHSTTHGKKAFNAIAVSDMVVELLDEVKGRTGEKYVAHFRDGALHVIGYGINTVVFHFDGKTTIATDDRLTIDRLVTRVKVVGAADDDGKTAVEAIVEGDTSFGVLQEIVRRDSDKTIEDAKAEAGTILKERGKPEETITITVPDLPFLRRGDRIEVEAANLKGFFYAIGLSHNATSKQMTLTLTRG